jgi:hypothetical protein
VLQQVAAAIWPSRAGGSSRSWTAGRSQRDVAVAAQRADPGQPGRHRRGGDQPWARCRARSHRAVRCPLAADAGCVAQRQHPRASFQAARAAARRQAIRAGRSCRPRRGRGPPFARGLPPALIELLGHEFAVGVELGLGGAAIKQG